MNIIPFNEWCTIAGGTPTATGTKLARRWLHHGASGTSTVATANAYARHHIRSNGWVTVGYSWLIAEGKVLEGRGPGRQGAHTQGDNVNAYGICMVGNYTSRRPADRDLDALVRLLRHGVGQGWWDDPRLSGGHRDAPGHRSNECPGSALHRLIPTINAAAASSKKDDMPQSGLTRIDGSAAVYDFNGQFLTLVTSKHQAALIVQHRCGLGGSAAKIVQNSEWQKYVGDLTPNEAAHFTVINRLSDLGGGLSQAQADDRYEAKGHRHSVSVELK